MPLEISNLQNAKGLFTQNHAYFWKRERFSS